MLKMKTEEKGSLIVEASFVFPIMFFVLFFLIYMGNMFYLRSNVDAIVTEYTIKAASCCVDPFLLEIGEGGVPTKIDNIQPYHSLIGGETQIRCVYDDMMNQLNQIGTGYFWGMNIRDIVVNQFKYNKGLVTSTFTTDVSYRIQFPIRFMGNEKPTILYINSCITVPVTDTPEFILNVDMAMDFFDSSGLADKLAKLVEQVKKFLG